MLSARVIGFLNYHVDQIYGGVWSHNRPSL
jgi:hypothetical protein